jgi:hypothetical protein
MKELREHNYLAKLVQKFPFSKSQLLLHYCDDLFDLTYLLGII